MWEPAARSRESFPQQATGIKVGDMGKRGLQQILAKHRILLGHLRKHKGWWYIKELAFLEQM